MKYITRGEVESQIEALKKEKEKVKGTKCEVYSRVVGYLRPVGAWNVGKKEEYKHRKLYKKCGGQELPK